MTKGRVIVGLVFLLNVGLVWALWRSAERTARLEARLDEVARAHDTARFPAAVGASAIERPDAAVAPTGRAAPSDAPPAEPFAAHAGSQAPLNVNVQASAPLSEDPDDEFARLMSFVRPSASQEPVLREAFDRIYPKALAALHAGDREKSQAHWREYCGAVRGVLDEAALNRLGCGRPPPLRPPERPPPATPEPVGSRARAEALPPPTGSPPPQQP